MSTLIAAIAIPVGTFIGICIVFWLIWQGIKAVGRRIRDALLGPEDINP